MKYKNRPFVNSNCVMDDGAYRSGCLNGQYFANFYFLVLPFLFLNKAGKKAENHKDESLFSAAKMARLKNTASLLSQTS